MASPLSSFLNSAKADFLAAVSKGDDLSNWVICTGNEAGDLDSLISSISFSYFSSLSPSPSPPSARHIPLIQTHSTDLYLRPENLYALSSSSIDPTSLLCIDEIPASSLRRAPSQGGPTYALVDHNVLLPSLLAAAEGKEEQVTAILDHHADESHHLSASPRVIQPVGSCVSLVVQHFLLSPSSSAAAEVPQELADLILSSILIDTGLKPSTTGGKATEVDLAAVQFLLPFASPSFSGSTSSVVGGGEPFAGLLAVNKVLGEKKFAVGHLDGRDLLRRDYKEYSTPSASAQGGGGGGGEWRYGLSTVPLPLSSWLGKEVEGKSGWELVLADLEAWKKERRLDMAAILTSFDVPSDSRVSVKKGGLGKHARELVVHVGVGEKGERLSGLLEGLEREESLALGSWKGGEEGVKGGEGWRVWQQGNVKATRKQVAPVIKALIKAL